jgi:hippurate hydrolase
MRGPALSVPSSLTEIAARATLWRRDLHRKPELLYDLHGTAAYVAARLAEIGVDDIVTGIGQTGLVGLIHGHRPGRTIAIRADMDALPIEEITGAAWASSVPGAMHACGHDGHTATLLAAAACLAATRDFAGTVVVLFQPAEEGGGGALAMIEDGVLDDFGIEEIYGLHNFPGMPLGHFALREGAIMASADRFYIDIAGRGGHAARPHDTIDPIIVGAAMVGALQTIVSRSVDPLGAAVVSVTNFHAGTTDNVIPQTAHLSGTFRALDARIRAEIETSIDRVVATLPATFGATASILFKRGYPVTVNAAEPTRFLAKVAESLVGADKVDGNVTPAMAAEDFAYYLERRPGAFLFMGNGPSAGLHSPAYDFDDAAILHGAGLWVRLVETRLAG